jgi:hypothetical protein
VESFAEWDERVAAEKRESKEPTLVTCVPTWQGFELEFTRNARRWKARAAAAEKRTPSMLASVASNEVAVPNISNLIELTREPTPLTHVPTWQDFKRELARKERRWKA